jgi:replicative DNA helicase
MTTSTVRRAAPLALTGALLAVVLTGCLSSNSDGSTATGTTTNGAAPTKAAATGTTTTTAAKPAGGKLDGVPTSCPSADEVMSNLHLSSLTVSGADPSMCQYLHNGDKSQPYAVITFNAAPGFTADMVKAGLVQEQSDVKPVSGVADAAYSFSPKEGQGVGLTFLSGSVVCSIFTSVPATVAGETALAGVILQG